MKKSILMCLMLVIAGMLATGCSSCQSENKKQESVPADESAGVGAVDAGNAADPATDSQGTVEPAGEPAGVGATVGSLHDTLRAGDIFLFEDEDLLVINKPKGMVVHPAPGHERGTLVNALLHHCGDSLSGIGGVKRPGIVHRLDIYYKVRELNRDVRKVFFSPLISVAFYHAL